MPLGPEGVADPVYGLDKLVTSRAGRIRIFQLLPQSGHERVQAARCTEAVERVHGLQDLVAPQRTIGMVEEDFEQRKLRAGKRQDFSLWAH